jgi:hypothetical protein
MGAGIAAFLPEDIDVETDRRRAACLVMTREKVVVPTSVVVAPAVPRRAADPVWQMVIATVLEPSECH